MKYGRLLSWVLVCLWGGGGAFGQDLTAEQWREDLAHLQTELAKHHVDLYHTTSKDEFQVAFQRLQRQIPDLERHEIIVELSRISALIGDGHSGIRLYSDDAVGFSSFPVRFYFYADGLFVRQIDPEFEECSGARVVQIGKLSTDEAMNAVAPLIPRDNEMWVKLYAPYFLASPEILHALKISDDRQAAEFVLEKDGERQTITLRPKGRLHLVGHAQTDVGMANIELVDAYNSEQPTPLYLKGDPLDSYWFEHLADHKAVYLRYNEVVSKPAERIDEFTERLMRFIDGNDVEKLIIDVRSNRGGGNEHAKPLLRKLIKWEESDNPGKLFLIVGRRTFSAAQSFVNELEKYTHVIIVGEPTGSQVNHYGDNFKIVLPNSGITARASYAKFEMMGPLEYRKWTAPHITAELGSADYQNGTDPALEAVLDYRPEPSAVELLREKVKQDGVATALQSYREFKSQSKNRYVDMDSLLIELATRLFRDDEMVREAFEILEFNVTEHPGEPNPLYFLGRACEFTGQSQLAVRHYERAYQIAEEKGQFAFAMRIFVGLDRVKKSLANPDR